MINLQLVVNVNADDDGTNLWADLPQLPGVFATGQTPTELGTSLGAAVELLLNDARAAAGLPPFPHPLPVPTEPTETEPTDPEAPTAETPTQEGP